MTFSPDIKAQCMALLKASGYPNRAGAVADVSRQMGVSRSAIRKWWAAGTHAPGPPPAMLAKAEKTLADAVRSELDAMFREMGVKRSEASYRELATAAVAFIEKLQLLQGEATSRVETIGHLLDGLSPEEYRAVVAEAEQILRDVPRWTTPEDDDESERDNHA